MAISTIRHDDVFPAYQHDDGVTVVGAGAIGSRVTAALVELGITNIDVIDFDVIEPHNLANQMYGVRDVGTPKVVGIHKWVEFKIGYIPATFKVLNEKITDDSTYQFKNTVFLCVDSIEARKLIVNKIKDEQHATYHIFDTRMASTHGNVVYLQPRNPMSVDKYLSALPTDEDAEVSSCGTSLSVGTTASIIANTAVWQFMHCKHNPDAMDKKVNIFMKPMVVSNG